MTRKRSRKNKKPSPPTAPAESYITVVFQEPDSVLFRYDRHKVSAWQLMAIAKTLEAIANLEIESWHVQHAAQQEARRPKIIVPGTQIPPDVQ